jgi:hypothetical protein
MTLDYADHIRRFLSCAWLISSYDCRFTGRITDRHGMLPIWKGSTFPGLNSDRSCRSAGVWSARGSACHVHAGTLPLLWGTFYLQGRFEQDWNQYIVFVYTLFNDTISSSNYMATADNRETMLLSPPMDRISITYNQMVQHSVGTLCYHSPRQHHHDFIV